LRKRSGRICAQNGKSRRGLNPAAFGLAGDGFRIRAPAGSVADQSVLEPQFCNSAAIPERGEHLSQFFVDAAQITRVSPVASLGGVSGLVFGETAGDSF
jgi:hypothetical protein